MSFKKDKRQETIIYLALWALLFMAPVLHLYIRTGEADSFDWSEIFMVWRQYGIFFLIFLIHNHLLAPILVYRQQRTLYFSLILAIMVLFEVYQCNHRPTFRGEKGRWKMESPLNDSVKIAKYDPRDYRPPRPDERDMRHRPGSPGTRPEFPENPGNPENPEFPEFPDNPDHPAPPENRLAPRPAPHPDIRHRDGRPPLMMGQQDIIAIVILILMLGMNVGIKLYFKQRGDQKRLAELEKQNLEQQLEYLKYQINPHFFMNTLNNIHALVDIDPEKAKETILELSKMMRFVLYEGNKAGVPIDREIQFLQNYITLMKLRYTDKVRITVKTPDSLPNKEVPPLMFITFVENAFKHGVSYRQESFISVELRVESVEFPTGLQTGSEQASGPSTDSRAVANSQLSTLNSHLVFVCKNSKIPKDEDKHGGVGLSNVKQRLDLIYGDQYTLDINDEQDTYSVTLTIPL